MNIDDMQSLWNSPENRQPTVAERALAGNFTRRMIRRRRFQAAWLINTFVWLTLITALAGWNIAERKVALEHQWALIPLLLVPWSFAIHFLRRFYKTARVNSSGEVSIADSLRAALASNRTEQTHLRLVGVLFAVFIPILAVCMWQLRATDKVSDRELLSMAVFFGGVLMISIAAVAARYFGRVLGQERQINALLAEFGDQ